jgi:hypothetical protein
MGSCLTSDGTQLLRPFSMKICRFSELLWYYSQYFRIMGSTAPPYPSPLAFSLIREEDLYYLINTNITSTVNIDLGFKKPVELGMACVKTSFGILRNLYFKGNRILVLILVISYLLLNIINTAPRCPLGYSFRISEDARAVQPGCGLWYLTV